MTALSSIKLTAMPWGVISAGGGDHHHPPCRIGLSEEIFCDGQTKLWTDRVDGKIVM